MISIIVPVYNSDKYLSRCLDSVLQQTYHNYEVIIINDGSNDNSQEIIDRYVAKDNRFRSFIQNNSGQAIARNKGVEMSRGDYIVFVDSDDSVEPNYLQNLSKIIELGLDLGFSNIKRIYDKKQNILEKQFDYISCTNKVTSIYDDKSILTKIMNAPYAKIIKKEFLVSNNIEFYSSKLYEDFLFTQSILLSNPKMAYIDDSSYLYYVHKNTSMTGNGNRAFEMFDVFDAVLNFSKTKNNFDCFKEEFEFLALYHVAIGTLYRYFCYKPFKFFYALSKCRVFLKNHSYSINNKYVKSMPAFVRLFLFIFYSNII